jgi:hypothetical protein
MVSKVYFIKALLGDGEQAISEKARRLFKTADSQNVSGKTILQR